MPPILRLLIATTTVLQLILPASASSGSTGCGKPLPSLLTPGGPSQSLTLTSRSVIGTDTTRQYIAYLPEQFATTNKEPKPLILAFHGQLQPARSLERISGLSTGDFNTEYVVVYPEGLSYQEPGQQWLGDAEAPPSSVLDDRIFATELLDTLTSTLCIDESRIYITGLSNGGGLTGLLACDLNFNKRIAGFAGVAAAFYTDDSLTEPLFGAGCDPQLKGRKVPFMELHGLNDSVIAYDGDNAPAPDTIPLPEWVDSWVERDGCSGTMPVVEVLEGGNVTKSSWSCDGVEDVVVHYAIDKFGKQSFPSVGGRTV